jgi:hypothetical protein
VEELTFLDLVILQRIEPGTVLEKFGPKINSQFFEAANILATVKQKGYIDFKSSFPGPTEVEVTQVGARMLEMADEKAKEAVDELDLAVLQNVVAGYNDPEVIKRQLNIRSGDLAFHIHKLVKQDLVSYIVKSGKISLSVTEDGFKKVSAMPKKEKPVEEMVVNGEGPPAEGVAPPAPAAPEAPVGPVKLDRWGRLNAKLEYYMENWKKNPKKIALYAVILILIVVVVAYLLLFLRK